jgi:hypothetical protein
VKKKVKKKPIPTLEKGTTHCAKCSWDGTKPDVYKNMTCLGCYEVFRLCSGCFPGTTACSQECQVKHRENVNLDLKKGIQTDGSKDLGPLFRKKP